MQNTFHAQLGPPGPQGNAGPIQLHPRGFANSRYIRSGGSRSLFRHDSIVICDSRERITLHLPAIDLYSELPDDCYYQALLFSVFVLEGSHRIVAANGNRINTLLSSVEIEDTSTRYDFLSNPQGDWLYTIHKSSV